MVLVYTCVLYLVSGDNIQQDAIIYPANSTVRLQCSRHGFVRNTGTRWGRVGRAPTGRLETLEALAESPITVPCPCPAGPRGITSETSESRSPFGCCHPRASAPAAARRCLLALDEPSRSQAGRARARKSPAGSRKTVARRAAR